MEVRLDKRYPIASGVAQAWAVLSDVYATAACMPGAAITEQIDETHFKGTVKSRIGPAQMLFGGEITVLARDPEGHALQLLAKGADKAGSSAQMNLTAHLEAAGEGSVLVGAAVVGVNGKLAQFGSRLLVPVADAMLAQFADNFRAAAAAVPAPAATDAMATLAAAPAMAEAATDEACAPPTRTPAAAVPPAHLTAAAAPPAVAGPAREINVLALAWTVIKGWFAGRFRKRG
ncbi:carbon monoxide dehydrogenase G protein [Rubrivivax sp. A210]|uniref:CoxG family protein n=1 Tax=Rubrivivax sp. A210 TaxID=2772301 RepID=UPI00191B8492|nr:SRPBCC family protein [Rubrivivax sp. A210]CAD5375083.1 carbon monoxide dehydrogenase G protein [Rubrivivax sp. A210]